ncbi:hypothetical protein B296_00001222 [Ensete ventricosum]|uniref:Uncharacterized protein n=1 Tax=Ensete ventricosum TaxID=4639 RepID=A0A427B5K7_ENSVE|nr:hypothetical protein B296_00001222 [Ensete ventricosum]
MALEKDRVLERSQACPLYGGEASIQRLDPPSLGSMTVREGEGSAFLGSSWSSLLPFLSDRSNSFSSTYTIEAVDALPQEALSILDCNATTSEHWAYSNASVLGFEQGGRMPPAGPPSLDLDDDCAAWIDAMDQNRQLSDLDIKHPTADSTLIHEQGYFAVENWCGVVGTPEKDKRQCHDRFGFIYPGAAAVDGLRESIGRATVLQKRPYTLCLLSQDASDMTSPKKQCRGNTGRIKDKSSPSKDPQSTAAKYQRALEGSFMDFSINLSMFPCCRIGGNGSASGSRFYRILFLMAQRFAELRINLVDLVTMLEKAISYVKFLQLQVKVILFFASTNCSFFPRSNKKRFLFFVCRCMKLTLSIPVQVLATDEFWPAQGARAPDVGQVKEALDAILSSHRDGNPSSKSAIRTFESAC